MPVLPSAAEATKSDDEQQQRAGGREEEENQVLQMPVFPTAAIEPF